MTKVPLAVSVVENRCDDATNLLKVIYSAANEVKKNRFAVCVKGMYFPHEDLSARMIEWVELLTILGAEKIFLYEFHVHPNVTKVLQYYVEEGKVDLTPLTLPSRLPSDKTLLHLYLDKKNKLTAVN
jgi:hypothetical protein